MINKVILIGNLGADPELRYTTGGSAVADLRLATSRKWTAKDGAAKEETEWHRVVVWGKQAETCKEYLSKGRQIYVEGRFRRASGRTATVTSAIRPRLWPRTSSSWVAAVAVAAAAAPANRLRPAKTTLPPISEMTISPSELTTPDSLEVK
jgi:hypothetical protein